MINAKCNELCLKHYKIFIYIEISTNKISEKIFGRDIIYSFFKSIARYSNTLALFFVHFYLKILKISFEKVMHLIEIFYSPIKPSKGNLKKLTRPHFFFSGHYPKKKWRVRVWPFCFSFVFSINSFKIMYYMLFNIKWYIF